MGWEGELHISPAHHTSLFQGLLPICGIGIDQSVSQSVRLVQGRMDGNRFLDLI